MFKLDKFRSLFSASTMWVPMIKSQVSRFGIKSLYLSWAVLVHTFNSNTQDAEAGGFPSV